MFKRFCTTELKVKPMFEWWQKNFTEIVEMRIGLGMMKIIEKTISTQVQNHNWEVSKRLRNKWGEIEWRQGGFPLIDDKIHHYKVKLWADSTG